MAPACRRGRRKTRCKQCLVQRPKTMEAPQELAAKTNSSSKLEKLDMEEVSSKEVPVSGCSTPEAKRFRIPDHLPCPPAPKKRRLADHHCSSHRTSISFFTPPDIELFFLFALQGASG